MTTKKTSCTCAACVSNCRHMPGWMTPAEATAAMDAGMARNLMLDWYGRQSTGEDTVFVICPAAVGREADLAATTDELYPTLAHIMLLAAGRDCMVPQPCSLLKDERCTIHDSGFKPRMCRESFQCRTDDEYVDKHAMVPEWDTDAGRTVVARWIATVGFNTDRMRGL